MKNRIMNDRIYELLNIGLCDNINEFINSFRKIDFKINYFTFQVSLWMDFIITILGSSYHLWNPLIFYYFHQKFRAAVKEYVEEEVRFVTITDYRMLDRNLIPKFI